jgi:hypothetical protein
LNGRLLKLNCFKCLPLDKITVKKCCYFSSSVSTNAAPVQLTAPSYWAQHAKFMPGRTRLVFTALQNQEGWAPAREALRSSTFRR